MCFVISPVTHCVGSQSTLLLALPSAPFQPWECQQLALVSLKHCFHKATSAKSLKSGPRTAVVTHLDLLWELCRQLRPWPGPTPTCMCPPSPQLLRSDLSQPRGHPCALDVLQVLNLQSRQQRCKSVACTATGRDFNPAS